jgi:cell division septation protein DedD
MDWLRRNWPDVAIGLALLAVIAGIVTTLVTGGSLFQGNQTIGGAAGPIPPAVQTPLQPDPLTSEASGEVPGVAAVPAEGGGEPRAPTPATPQVGSVAVLAPDGTPVATPPVTNPAAPPASTPAPTPAATPVATPAPTVAPVPATPTPTAPETAAVVAPPVAPTPAPSVPTSAAAGATTQEAPFRVSVGAFSSPENAARQAQVFRDAGFPVFLGNQETLTIVLVGPYNTEQEAETVRARIAAGNFGIEPVVYRFRPDAPTSGASTPNPGATTTPASPTPAPPTAAPPTAAAGAARSLQVGAFADAASAAPLRARLSSIGLASFELREDGLIKLLVGPFEPVRLNEVRTQLRDAGIESFPR